MASATLEAAVMQYAPEVLPRLRRMTEPDLKLLLDEVDAVNQAIPLAFMPGQRVIIARWEAEQPLPAFQIIALLVFGLWTLAGEDETKADFLLEKWPHLQQTAQDCRGDERV